MTDIIELVTTAGICVVSGCTEPQTDGLCTTHRAEFESGTLDVDRLEGEALGVNR